MKNTQHPVLSKGEYSEYVLPPSELFGDVGDLFYESQENIKRATTDLINTLKQYKIPACIPKLDQRHMNCMAL